MSLISAKWAATASGVQSDAPGLILRFSDLITANEGGMMVRVGASSPRDKSTAGVIASGFISASAAGAAVLPVHRVAAVAGGVKRMLFLRLP